MWSGSLAKMWWIAAKGRTKYSIECHVVTIVGAYEPKKNDRIVKEIKTCNTGQVQEPVANDDEEESEAKRKYT